METKEIFAERVIELRREKGIGQAQLAERVGISKTSANLYESASRVPDIQVLARYAKELDVTADYLLGLTDNRTAENAIVGSELGLWDTTIAQLKVYVEMKNCLNDLQSHDPDESALMLIDAAIESGNWGKNEDEVKENVNNVLHTLNLIIDDMELLTMLHDFLFCHVYSTKLDVYEKKDRDAIALMKITKHLIEKADGIQDICNTY